MAEEKKKPGDKEIEKRAREWEQLSEKAKGKGGRKPNQTNSGGPQMNQQKDHKADDQ